MGIRVRVLLALTVVVTVLGILLYAVGAYFVAQVLEQREQLEVRSTLDRAEEALGFSAEQLSRTAEDWGSWDETYEFLLAADSGYVNANLRPESLNALGVDFMVFLDSDGSIHQVAAVNPDGSAAPDIPTGLRLHLESEPFAHASLVGEGVSGVLVIPEGLTIVAQRPVLRSDGSGPAVGGLLVGSFIEQSEMETLARLTGEKLTLHSVDDTAVSGAARELSAGTSSVIEPADARTIRGYRMVDDIHGDPAVVVAIEQPRPTTLLVAESTRMTTLFSILAVLVVVLTVSLVVDHLVLRRLSQINSGVSHVAATGEPTRRLDVAGSDELGSLAKAINTMLDTLHSSEQEVRYLADHDALTGLANRRGFELALRRTLAEARRVGSHSAILWLDLDNFKDINDSYGHAAGDELLQQVAKALEAASREYTTLGRIGGDEFAIVLPQADEIQAKGAAERLLSVLRDRVFSVSGHDARVNASIGIALYPEHADTAADLLVRADLAMYQAKAAGGGVVRVYAAGSQARLTERMAWSERLASALSENRLILHEQRIAQIDDGEDELFELLVRMLDADGSVVYPDEFIPSAEYMGFIGTLDKWVLGQAIELIRAEKDAGRSTCYSVNISASSMTDPSMVGLVRDSLHETGADASRLIIEITETAAISDITAARRFIDDLRGLGCRFAIDDFGSGMASFYYLKHLAVDFLKIDGELIKGLMGDGNDRYFVDAILEMCRGLEMATVAEHVEDESLYDVVCGIGFDYAQGYYLGRPGPTRGSRG